MDTPGIINSSRLGWASAHPEWPPLTSGLEGLIRCLGHPATQFPRKSSQGRYACGVALPKKAALYSMSAESEQCLTRAQERYLTPPMHVTIKTPEEQEKMRVAGRLAAQVL